MNMDFLAQLRLNYIAELPERLEKLETELLRVEREGDANSERFQSIFRAVHSMKGSGGTYGFFIITTVCHQFEDYLRAVGGESIHASLKAEYIPNCLHFLDILQDIADISMSGSEEFSSVEKKLSLLINTLNSSKKLTALIVTDSKSVAEYCRKVTLELGINAKLSDNSYASLLQLLTAPYDILITGAELPMLTGYSLLAAVRLSESVNRNIFSILITSKSDRLDKTKRDVDPDFVLKKDGDFGVHLESVLRNIIKQPQRRRIAG